MSDSEGSAFSEGEESFQKDSDAEDGSGIDADEVEEGEEVDEEPDDGEDLISEPRSDEEDEEEAEEYEDEEQDRRKAKKRKVEGFIIDESDVDDDYGEDDDEDEWEQGAEALIDKTKTEYNVNEQHYPRRLPSLLPSVKDPNLWMVKCVIGQEKEAAIKLMRKFIAYQNTEEPLLIKSVVAVEGLKGYVYIESFKQTHVKQAINGVGNLRIGQWTQKMVPLKEMTDVLKVVKEMAVLKTKSWVRLKSGVFKGDLGQVDYVDQIQNQVILKLLPRIDYTRARGIRRTALTQARKREKCRPDQKLFNLDAVRRIGGKVDTDGDFLIFEGNRYSYKGFLFKSFAMSAIKHLKVCKIDIPSIVEKIKKEDIAYVRFEQTCFYGTSRSKTVPARHFKEKAKRGLGMPLGIVSNDPRGDSNGDQTYRGNLGCPDIMCFPDLSTFQVLPWSKRTARVLMEPRLKIHPRVVARRQLERLSKMGISLLSACKFEFYLVDKVTRIPINNDRNTWSTIAFAAYEDILQTFMDGISAAGVDVDCGMTEAGPGQIEITFKPEFGIKAADHAFTFRTGIKEMAIKNGYIASFMSKPFPDKSGSSCHLNHSLWDSERKQSVIDAYSPTGLTETGQHWVAGLLAHAPAISLLCAPTINCLKRFPVNATWGLDNRFCAIRVKVNEQDGTYIENRMGASACNPYIALAATVAAGVDGISKQLKLPPAVKGLPSQNSLPGTSLLPNNMEDAMTALQEDDVIVDALGPEFISCFLAHRRNELKLKSKAENGSWEYDMFFDYM